jgi:hypothetical protein
MHRIAIPTLTFLLVACSGANTGGATPEGDPLDPKNLFPLGEGYVWNYDVEYGDELPVLGTRTVDRIMGARVELIVGAEREVYELRDEGIYHPATSTWLLKAPIREGAEWPCQGGRLARVTSTSATVEVPAGRFEHCVRVEETGGEANKYVQTVYCPHVGPVFVETRMELTLAEAPASVIGRLRGCNLRERNEGTPCIQLE